MYNPTRWQDHVTDPKNEYIIEPLEGDRYRITPCGEVLSRGTLLSAENFNKQEKGLLETITALGALLQKTMLNEDELSNLSSIVLSTLSNLIFITEETTIEASGYGYNSLITYTSYKFPEGLERNNENYEVIPFITGITTTDLNEDQTEIRQAAIPTIFAYNKTTSGFDIARILSVRDSDFETATYKMLIIGGL